jgi:hypothetical protein
VAATVTVQTGTPAASAEGFDHSHALFAGVLAQSVRDGRVHYGGLKERPEDLRSYLDHLSSVSEAQFETWLGEQRLAFLINLYNASTLDLIVQHYPVSSIKDIGSFFRGPWKQPVVSLFDEKTTLDHLEHGMLRKDYEEPRIHFALVCAARGCPPLRGEPYVAERLDTQLEEQGRSFLSTPEKNRVDLAERTVYLSPIFKWFADDFKGRGGSVLEFIRPYFPAEVSAELRRGSFKVKYTHYDWTLNDLESAPSEKRR